MAKRIARTYHDIDLDALPRKLTELADFFIKRAKELGEDTELYFDNCCQGGGVLPQFVEYRDETPEEETARLKREEDHRKYNEQREQERIARELKLKKEMEKAEKEQYERLRQKYDK